MPFALLGGLAKGLLAKGISKLAARPGRIAARAAMGGGGVLRSLPGSGLIAGGAAATGALIRRNPVVSAGIGLATGAIVGYLADGTPVMGKRRRGRGFSARDIRQTRRMFRLINDMSCAMKGVAKKRCP